MNIYRPVFWAWNFATWQTALLLKLVAILFLNLLRFMLNMASILLIHFLLLKYRRDCSFKWMRLLQNEIAFSYFQRPENYIQLLFIGEPLLREVHLSSLTKEIGRLSWEWTSPMLTLSQSSSIQQPMETMHFGGNFWDSSVSNCFHLFLNSNPFRTINKPQEYHPMCHKVALLQVHKLLIFL